MPALGCKPQAAAAPDWLEKAPNVAYVPDQPKLALYALDPGSGGEGLVEGSLSWWTSPASRIQPAWPDEFETPAIKIQWKN